MGGDLMNALRAAQAALAAGNFPDVVRNCKVVLKTDRSNYDGYVVLGTALLRLNQPVQAETALRRAAGVLPSALPAWESLVELYELTGDTSKLIGACEEIVKQVQILGTTLEYAGYFRKLAAAQLLSLNYDDAVATWKRLLEIDGISDELRFEGMCALADTRAALHENAIHKEYKKRLEQKDATMFSSGNVKEQGTDALEDENTLRSVEEELNEIESNGDLEKLLRKTTRVQGAHLQRQQELLLRLLVVRMRAARRNGGNWRQVQLELLQECILMIISDQLLKAFEIGSIILDDDDGETLLGKLEAEFLKQEHVPSLLVFRRSFIHYYPHHGRALAALAFLTYQNSFNSTSLERSRIVCEKALRLEDSCVMGWQLLAEVRAHEGSHHSAAECVRRGHQAISRLRSEYGLGYEVAEVRLRLTLAQTYLESKNYTGAELAFMNVAEVSENLTGQQSLALVVSAKEGLAKVSLGKGDMETACTRLDVVLSLSPLNHWAFAEKGWLTYQNGNLNQALQYLEQAAALQPGVASYHHRLGLLYWKTGDNLYSHKDKALSHFLESAKLDPSQSEVFRYLGHYYRNIGAENQRAARCYKKAVMLEPEDEEAGEGFCDLMDMEGQEVLEMVICREVSQRSPQAFWAWRRLGLLQVQRKEWSEAVRNLQHALRGYFNDPNSWEALGLSYQHLGMLTAALKAYERAITLENSSPVFALLQSGSILLLLTSYSKAIDIFRKALEKSPHHVAALCGLAEAILGHARECTVNGDNSSCAGIVEETIQLLRDSTPSCNNVAFVWKLLGDLEVSYAQSLPFEGAGFDKGSGSISLGEGVHSAINSWFENRRSALKRAKNAYLRALHLCPSQGSLFSDLGLSLKLIWSLDPRKVEQEVSWSMAVRTVCGGLRLDGANPDLWVTLGEIAAHPGLRQHAYIQALRIDGNHALAWADLGQLYLKENHEDLARQAFDRARSTNPALAAPWAGMALIHSTSSKIDLEEAYASCLYAANLSPTVEVQLGLGVLSGYMEQLQDAQVNFNATFIS